MPLYEEKLTSALLMVLVLPGVASMLVGLLMAGLTGSGIGTVAFAMVIFLAVMLDVLVVKIEIDEREIRIRGLIGLVIRKTIPLEEVEGFSVRHEWKDCSGRIHFTLPAEGCVVLVRKKGWSVSFSTNNPIEVAKTLEMLGVQRI